MSKTSHPHDEERGKHPAREAPDEHGEVPRKRDDSEDDKTDPYHLTMAVSVIRNGNFLGTLMRRAAE